MPGPHEIRQVVSCKQKYLLPPETYFPPRSHSQCSIFVEVDCSGYGAASVVRASLRHVIEDVMDGNITTGKHTVLLVPESQWQKLTSTVTVSFSRKPSDTRISARFPGPGVHGTLHQGKYLDLDNR